MFRRIALFSALPLSLAAPAMAAGPFVPPSGCTLQITIQNRGCTVSQHFTCAADKAGDQWVTYFGTDGPRFTSRIDAETRWMESTNLTTGVTDHLEPKASDHASFKLLLKQGEDTFDFWTNSTDGERLHHIGKDILTGASVTIDNVPLEVTEFEITTFNEQSQPLIERKGSQYISREHGRFYGGREESRDWTGRVESSDESPVTFAFSGDAGFGVTTPQYDCEVQMVRAPAPTPLARLLALSEHI